MFILKKKFDEKFKNFAYFRENRGLSSVFVIKSNFTLDNPVKSVKIYS